MPRRGFLRGIAFAALAAVGALPWLLVARPFLGSATALDLYLVAVTAAYLGDFVAERPRRAAVFLIAGLAGIALAILTRNRIELVTGLGVLVAIIRSGFLRSGFLHRSPAARAVVTEAILVGAGLAFARHLGGPSLAGVVLAIWGFFLVQSFYPLVGGIRVRSRAADRDPFEEAHARALAILQRCW